MVPSAAVHCNSREVPIALLLPSRPAVTGFLATSRDQGVYQFDTDRPVVQHEPAAFLERQPGPRAVAVGPRATVYWDIIGLDVKYVNRKMANILASRTTVLSGKYPVIHSSS
jgi:hypothetical protein